MNVLIFLEPVIYRSSPAGLRAHFKWLDYFVRWAVRHGGALAICSNMEVLNAWEEHSYPPMLPISLYAIDPFKVLSDFSHSRDQYSQALYSNSVPTNYLTDALLKVCEKFQPDLIVMTAENALARHAFGICPTLCIEQSPLPRAGHPFRSSFDPLGHQTSSGPEQLRTEVESLALPATITRDLKRILAAMRLHAKENLSRLDTVRDRMKQIRSEGKKIALLATQPPDGATYEGACGHAIALESLVYLWADQLPDGWVGIPTYHAGASLSGEMEAALARSQPKLRFLPLSVSVANTEALCTEADGVVTISSTSAAAGLLFGKSVAVTGKSPFQSWCATHPSRLTKRPQLSKKQILALLFLLINRYSVADERLMKDIDILDAIIQAARDRSNIAGWWLDPEAWSLDDALSLFAPTEIFRGSNGPESNKEEVLLASIAELTNERDAYRLEWRAAVADRDRINLELAKIDSQRAVFCDELNRAVSDRGQILFELQLAREQCALLQKRRKAAPYEHILLGSLSEIALQNEKLRDEVERLKNKTRILAEELKVSRHNED